MEDDDFLLFFLVVVFIVFCYCLLVEEEIVDEFWDLVIVLCWDCIEGECGDVEVIWEVIDGFFGGGEGFFISLLWVCDDIFECVVFLEICFVWCLLIWLVMLFCKMKKLFFILGYVGDVLFWFVLVKFGELLICFMLCDFVDWFLL